MLCWQPDQAGRVMLCCKCQSWPTQPKQQANEQTRRVSTRADFLGDGRTSRQQDVRPFRNGSVQGCLHGGGRVPRDAQVCHAGAGRGSSGQQHRAVGVAAGVGVGGGAARL